MYTKNLELSSRFFVCMSSLNSVLFVAKLIKGYCGSGGDVE